MKQKFLMIIAIALSIIMISGCKILFWKPDKPAEVPKVDIYNTSFIIVEDPIKLEANKTKSFYINFNNPTNLTQCKLSFIDMVGESIEPNPYFNYYNNFIQIDSNTTKGWSVLAYSDNDIPYKYKFTTVIVCDSDLTIPYSYYLLKNFTIEV